MNKLVGCCSFAVGGCADFGLVFNVDVVMMIMLKEREGGCRNLPSSRSKAAARVLSRSLGPTLTDHARLTLSQACSTFRFSTWDRYQNYRPGWQEPTMIIYIKYGSWGRGASAGVGVGARLRGGSGSGGAQVRFTMAQRELQNSESGARARREYACNANTIRETVHVSVELQMTGARGDDSL
eukprot:3651424-Pleurochrysis_carterae.AAC.1